MAVTQEKPLKIKSSNMAAGGTLPGVQVGED